MGIVVILGLVVLRGGLVVFVGIVVLGGGPLRGRSLRGGRELTTLVALRFNGVEHCPAQPLHEVRGELLALKIGGIYPLTQHHRVASVLVSDTGLCDTVAQRGRAVDTAEALCRAAKAIGWRTIVADARGKFATPERIPSADELVVAWPDEVLARVEPDHATAVVILTHDDRFDIPALQGALAGESFYVGALGSRRNQARRRERLLEAGVPEETVDRISGPAGLDIGADSPAETALSILAEILAVRAARAGGPLKEAPGRIHAAV